MTKVQVKQVNRSGLNDHTTVDTVDYYEVDVDGNLYLFNNEYGSFALVIADNFENAFSELLDESDPISDEDYQELQDEYDLSDGLPGGYYYQDNFTPNTCGIVNLGEYWQYVEYDNPTDILHNPMLVTPMPSDEYPIDWDDFQDLFDPTNVQNDIHSDRAKVVLTILGEDGNPLPKAEIIDGDTYLKYLVYNLLNGHNRSLKSWEQMAKILDYTVNNCIAFYFADLTSKIEEYLGYELDYRLSCVDDTLLFVNSLDGGFFGIVTDQPIPDDVLILESGDRDMYSLSIAWNEYKHIFEITTLGDLRDMYEQDVKNGEYSGHEC